MQASTAQATPGMAAALRPATRVATPTTAYQGYGRGLNLAHVKTVVDFAVGEPRPTLTLLFHVPPQMSRDRLASGTSRIAASEVFSAITWLPSCGNAPPRAP